jgi:tripartite-type tricarboxylate transporter receptor subunit TctC
MTFCFPRPARALALSLGAFFASFAAPLNAAAQTRFPERPITIVVPFGPGGIADLTARAVAEQMSKTLGQAVVVDNKPSAGSIVATQFVANARPDGYTLLLMSNSNAVSVGLFRKLPYDTLHDFAPITTLGYFDLGIFVPAGSKFLNLSELLADAKARPGRMNVGTIAPGSTQHLAAKLFETVAGVDVLVIPYKNTPAVITALRAGEIDAAFEIVGPMLSQAGAGAVKALAVTSDQRNPALPEVPTVAQMGVASYNVASWNALAAPAETPPEVLEKIGRAAREAVSNPAVQSKLGKLGMRLAPSSPEQMQTLMAGEIKRWGAVIRASKIELE